MRKNKHKASFSGHDFRCCFLLFCPLCVAYQVVIIVFFYVVSLFSFYLFFSTLCRSCQEVVTVFVCIAYDYFFVGFLSLFFCHFVFTVKTAAQGHGVARCALNATSFSFTSVSV